MRHRRLAFGSAFLVLSAAVAASEETPAEAPAPSCRERFLALQVLHDSIPKEFIGLKEERLRQVQEAVDKLIADAEAFRKECPDAPEKAWAAYYLGYTLSINSQVWYFRLDKNLSDEEKLRRRDAYFERIADLAREVLAAEGIERRLRMLAELLVGQVLANTGKPRQLFDHYRRFISLFPDSPDLDRVHFGAARAAADAQLWSEAEKWTKSAMKKFPRSRHFPHMGNLMTKICTGSGKLAELAKYWEENEPVYRARAKDPQTPEPARGEYEQYADWAKYWIPFAYFALGDFDKARARYREGREFLLAKKDRGGISQATGVFLQRIETDLDVLENLVEMPAPPWELDWVSDERPSLRDCEGRGVLIVFRSYEWERANDALLFLNEIYEELGGPAGPLEVLTITWYKGMRDIEGQRAIVRAEAEKLGLIYGVGIEPTDAKTVHRAYNADVGGSTIVAIDPLGRVVWYKQDPRPHDFGTIRRVIDRITR